MKFDHTNHTKHRERVIQSFKDEVRRIPTEDKCSMYLYRGEIEFMVKEGLIIKNPSLNWLDRTFFANWVVADGSKPNLKIYQKVHWHPH